jgi:hypothetical protein
MKDAGNEMKIFQVLPLPLIGHDFSDLPGPLNKRDI